MSAHLKKENPEFLLPNDFGVCNLGGEAKTPAAKVSSSPPARDVGPDDDWGHLSDARHAATSPCPDDCYTISSRR